MVRYRDGLCRDGAVVPGSGADVTRCGWRHYYEGTCREKTPRSPVGGEVQQPDPAHRKQLCEADRKTWAPSVPAPGDRKYLSVLQVLY